MFNKIVRLLILGAASGALIHYAPANAAQTDSQWAAADRQREQTVGAMSASLEKQKVSVRRQKTLSASEVGPDRVIAPSDFFVTDSLLSAATSPADCDPISQLQVQSLAERAGKANRVSSDLVRAVMKQESGFRPCVVSPAGAVGLMQLMPNTAEDLGVADAADSEANVFGGAKLLRQLMDRYGNNLNLTLGAYNAGPANVDRAHGVPDFPETLHYVDSIVKSLFGVLPAGNADPGTTAKPTAGN